MTSEGLCVFGPRDGYTPQIGILVSQLNWMRTVLLGRLRDLSPDQLDWRMRPDGNSIGALLLHLAATDVYYGLNTFDGLPWAAYSQDVKQRLGPAMRLGDLGRDRIKGHDLTFYLAALAETREHTLAQFKTREDEWLFAVDTTWGW